MTTSKLEVIGFSGKYLQIDRPHRMVCTSVFEMMPEHEAVETVSFEEKDGGNMVTTHTRHASIEASDGHLAGGRMAAGMTDGYERLEALASRMAGGN